jgi:hypothetical protein
MLEDGVFDEGYDSDGYIGPDRGTDEEEVELEEEAVATALTTSETVRRMKMTKNKPVMFP